MGNKEREKLDPSLSLVGLYHDPWDVPNLSTTSSSLEDRTPNKSYTSLPWWASQSALFLGGHFPEEWLFQALFLDLQGRQLYRIDHMHLRKKLSIYVNESCYDIKS